MKSMTGYAKVQSTFGDKKVNIEIKTLNSKQLDLIVKLPAAYRSHELDIRAMLGSLERGKVECILSEESTTANASGFNRDLLISRYNALADVANDLHAVDLVHRASLFTTVASMGDIWNSTTSDEVSDEEWQHTAADLQQAINLCDQFRAHEGSVLEVDFHKHVDLIEEKLRRIPALEGERIDTAKERIKRYLADAAVEVDQNRFEQELIYYSYTEETAPYRRQNTPLPTYQIYVEDPLAPEGTNGYVTAWNIDYFPMIRPIIGPREDVATDLFIADCSTNTEDSAFSVVINSEEMCGSEGVNLAVGGNYNFTISAAEDHTVLDNIYVNGVQAQIYDPNDPDHATPPEDPFYLSFYNTENNNDNVTVVVDAQGTEEVVLYRGYYVLHFYDLAEVAAPYVISATFHTEEWIHVGIDPVAPEAVLSLYPNPATSTVKLNINGVSGMVDCSIIDMSGRVVYNARVNAETENTIDVSNMPAGAYFVRVTNNTFSKIEKLIIK